MEKKNPEKQAVCDDDVSRDLNPTLSFGTMSRFIPETSQHISKMQKLSIIDGKVITIR